MQSSHVYPYCEDLQTVIQCGIIEIEEKYVEVIIRMQEFLKKLIEFSIMIGK
jgi:hypothetical protein